MHIWCFTNFHFSYCIYLSTNWHHFSLFEEQNLQNRFRKQYNWSKIRKRSFNLYFSRKFIQNSLIFPLISFSKSINSSSTNTSRHGTDVLHAIHVWPLAAPKVNDTWKKMMMYDLHTNRVVIDDRKFRNRIWNWIR